MPEMLSVIGYIVLKPSLVGMLCHTSPSQIGLVPNDLRCECNILWVAIDYANLTGSCRRPTRPSHHVLLSRLPRGMHERASSELHRGSVIKHLDLRLY